MAYTRVWSEAIPAGTDAASSIDDSVRALRLDIRERMTDLVTSWSADPVVAQDKITGKAVSKTLIISPHALQGNINHNNDTDVVTLIAAATTARMPVPIPPGCTITAADVILGANDAAGGQTVNLKRITYDIVSTPTVIATVNKAISSAKAVLALAGGGLPHLVLVATLYIIEIINANPGGVGFYGARITYDTPDSRFTY